MKKVLLATSFLVATTGIAAAEVVISGEGRFGLFHDSGVADGINETQLSYRLRFNIDASKETDAGVKFGGRIRLQYDNGDNTATGFDADGDPTTPDDFISTGGEAGAELSQALLYTEYGGFRVEVGNANGAFDNLATLYNTEFGFISFTQGSYNLSGAYQSFNSGPRSAAEADYVGIYAQYVVGDLSAKASWHTPDQTGATDDISEEYSVAVDYTFGQFKVGAGYVGNSGFVDGDSGYALTGEYAVSDIAAVGLQFTGRDRDGDDADGITLYGKTEFNGVGVGAFVSSADFEVDPESDVAYGLGASYDLGGATLAGTIQRSFDETTVADLGVKFTF